MSKMQKGKDVRYWRIAPNQISCWSFTFDSYLSFQIKPQNKISQNRGAGIELPKPKIKAEKQLYLSGINSIKTNQNLKTPEEIPKETIQENKQTLY